MKKIIAKYPIIFYIILVVLFSVLYTSSCSKNPTDSSKEIVLPDSNLSYDKDIFLLFHVKCGGSESGCHGTLQPAKGLILTNYQNMITHLIDGSELLIIPEKGEISFLYNILRGPISGRPQMPYERMPLSVNNINGIRTWIDEGAHQ